MNIRIIDKPQAKQRNEIPKNLPTDNQIGFFAVVKELHPETNSVHVIAENGRYISNVRVASFEWVTINKEEPKLTGERCLPPVGTYVFCLMPNCNYDDVFILCSLFTESTAHSEFKEKNEDAKYITKRIENGGWQSSSDYRNGTKKYNNKSKNIILEINQEDSNDESIKLNVYENEIVINKNGITIKTDKEIKNKIENNYEIITGGNINISSEKTGTLRFGNSIDTLGKIISNLFQQLIGLKTFGSPANHQVSPDFVAEILKLKTTWEQIFK